MEPHLATADIEDVGDRPVLDRVVRDVRVQQEHRHPADLRKPDGDRQIASRQLDAHRERQAVRVLDACQRQPTQVVVGVGVLLMTVRIDRLAEVALAVEQPDPDEWQSHIAGRLHVIAGEHAEAARVDTERLVDAVLGAEIGDRAVEPVAIPLVEPVAGPVRHVAVEVGQDILVLGHELLVVEQPRPLCRAADDRNGVPIAVPRRPVDQAPKVPCLGIPRPVEVVREAPEALQAGRQRERRSRDRRDGDWVHGRA